MEFSEKLLFHIWDAQHIVKKPSTISGKQIQIMYQGQWNTDFGPDFRNCIISINNRILRGCVEIHRTTYDWSAHNHQEDPNYNNTILHVVYEHNGQYSYTITEDGTHIEILELKQYLDQDLSKLIKKFKNYDFLYPELCDFFAGLDSHSIKLLLINLGISRIEKKIKRYKAELYFCDFNQLLYQGLMESCGYSKNTYNMLQIAHCFPYLDLLDWKTKGLTLQELQAIFIWASGLQKHIPKIVPEELLHSWEVLYQKQCYTENRLDCKWNLFRVRPVNHPVIRIMQITNFLYSRLSCELLPFFIKLFSDSDDNNFIKHISSRLANKFNCDNLPKDYHIGIKRLDTIIINILIPILTLYTDKMDNQILKDRLRILYREYPALTPNNIETFMSEKYLNSSQQKLIRKKAIYQQGLLKIYYDYCQHHNCNLCRVQKKDLILNM